jgi:hypothetical protein
MNTSRLKRLVKCGLVVLLLAVASLGGPALLATDADNAVPVAHAVCDGTTFPPDPDCLLTPTPTPTSSPQ